MVSISSLGKFLYLRKDKLPVSEKDRNAQDLISRISTQEKKGRLDDRLISDAVDFLEKNKHLGRRKRGYIDQLAGYLADCYVKNLMGPEGSEGRERYEEHYFNCNHCFKKALRNSELYDVIKAKGPEIFK